MKRKDLIKQIEKIVKEEDLWKKFLKNVIGVGPVIAAVLMTEFDLEKGPKPSSFIKYAGLDVVDGEARSKKKEHLIEVEYVDKNGKKKIKKSITFNDFLRSKLLGVLASSFLKAGARSDCKYEKIYRRYREWLETDPRHKDKSKGHKNNMAKRYAVKIFVEDLHQGWMKVEGKKPIPPYRPFKGKDLKPRPESDKAAAHIPASVCVFKDIALQDQSHQLVNMITENGVL